MFGLGVPEIVVILVVALLVFGPGRLPEIGGALGKGIRDFRKAFEGSDKDEGAKLEARPSEDGQPKA